MHAGWLLINWSCGLGHSFPFRRPDFYLKRDSEFVKDISILVLKFLKYSSECKWAIRSFWQLESSSANDLMCRMATIQAINSRVGVLGRLFGTSHLQDHYYVSGWGVQSK